MHAFFIKPGVECSDLHPDKLATWPKIARVFALFGYDATVTEVKDTIDRTYRSFHKTVPVKATDWRTWANGRGEQMDMSIKQRICEAIERECPGVQAIAKPTHIHTELDG